MRIILFQKSETQRVSLKSHTPNSILISKEWRKTKKDIWNTGKGIEIPINQIPNLKRKLEVFYQKGVQQNETDC